MQYASVSAAQRAVLGLALLAPAAAQAVCDRLRDDQLDPPARHVLAAIRDLVAEQHEAEPVTVSGWLDSRGLLEECGGRRAIDLLTSEAASIGSIDVLCRDLALHATWRDRARSAQAAQAAASAQDEQAWNAVMEDVDQDTGATGLQLITGQQWADEIHDHIAGGVGVPEGVIETPWPEINHGLFGGFWPGDLALIVGYSNHGKTVVAGDVAYHAAQAGRKVHTYLTEDHGIGRGSRILSRASGVPTWRIMERQLRPQDHEAIGRGLSRITYGKTPVAGRTAQEICAHIRRSRWDLAIVDHLHDLAYRDERELTSMVLAFRAEANRGRTAIVLCAQPNSARATQDGRARLSPPSLHSIKGGGSVRDAANTVLTIHQEQEDDGTPTGEAKLRALKTRTSRYPVVDVHLSGRFNSFAPDLDLEAA